MSDNKSNQQPPGSSKPNKNERQESILQETTRQEFLRGLLPEGKEKWGALFDKELWPYIKPAVMEAQERGAEPHLRDILKREQDELRPRNEALEKWGPAIEQEIERDLERERLAAGKSDVFRRAFRSASLPQMGGPDMDME